MPIYDLFGDPPGLPKTTRSGIPYEIEAISPRETWGAGNGNTSIICRVKWVGSENWIRDMVGEASVVAGSGTGAAPVLKRYVPEPLGFDDNRIQFCFILDQTEQGQNPTPGANFSTGDTNWPETKWLKYKAIFEAPPYAILNDSQVADIVAAAGAAGGYAGAQELYRYVIRKRKFSNKEQNTPSANVPANLGYFFVDDVTPANRKVVPGAYINRPIVFGEITLRWVRIPIGWPPPAGYRGQITPWPPVFNPAAGDPSAILRARDSYIGSVNNDWFDVAAPDGICVPPETLMYTGYSDDNKYFDAAGDWVCDVDMFFKFKGGVDATGAVGSWNHVMDASGVWRRISADNVPGDGSHGTSAGRPLYFRNNMNNLFTGT